MDIALMSLLLPLKKFYQQIYSDKSDFTYLPNIYIQTYPGIFKMSAGIC